MPIFIYFAAVGSVLIALMFFANATLEKSAPAISTTQRVGLPQSPIPDPTQILTSTPAPAPDMTSPLVRAAIPTVQPAPEVLAVEPEARAARAAAPPQNMRTEFRQNQPRDFGLAGF